MTDFINDLMDLTPNVEAMFAEPEQQKFSNQNIYKTNPNTTSKEVSPDGHYRSKVRIIYNPFNKQKSIIERQFYNFNDIDGYFQIDSKLMLNDKSCPYFSAWKSLHYSKDETIVTNYEGKDMTRQMWGDAIFNKSKETYCLVQVIEDENKPELVGKILAMKLSKHVYDLLMNKMNPSDKSKAPVDIMNYLFGPMLNIDVTPGPDDPSAPERKNREIKYTLCDFDSDPSPVINIDGTPMFSEEELDSIMEYFDAKKVFSNPKATQKKKDDAKNKCESLTDVIKPLMQRALDIISENALDLEKEFGYHEPDAEKSARGEKWLKSVLAFHDPKTYIEATLLTEANKLTPAESGPTSQENDFDDDLPF